MTKEKDTSSRLAAMRQNLARKNSIPFNSSTSSETAPVAAPVAPVEPVKAETLAPVTAPVAPAEQVKTETPAPVAAPVAPAEPVKAEAPAPVAAPVAPAEPVKAKAPAPVTLSKAVKPKAEKKSGNDETISMQLSVSFNEAHHEIAQQLAAKIGCSTEDIIKLVGKEIQVVNVDPDDNKAQKRAGQSKRLSLKFNQSGVDNLRAEKDPLNVKTDLILVRNSVLNFFDSVAETVLAELKLKHGI